MNGIFPLFPQFFHWFGATPAANLLTPLAHSRSFLRVLPGNQLRRLSFYCDKTVCEKKQFADDVTGGRPPVFSESSATSMRVHVVCASTRQKPGHPPSWRLAAEILRNFFIRGRLEIAFLNGCVIDKLRS